MTNQSQAPLYEEHLVPPYTLPDPLTCLDGSPVEAGAGWVEKRRPEILRLFEQHMFGAAPGLPERVDYRQASWEKMALGGLAERKQVTIRLANAGAVCELDLLLYLPARRSGPAPVFLSLNFFGNHTVHPDPGIALARSWLPDRAGAHDHQATEESRGTASGRWAVERILERGYGLATIYYGDIDPDFDDGFQNGVHALFPGARGPEAWGSIAAWAWGLSRALDHLETDPDVDAGRAAVVGHSRLGKAALWAGAVDARFALVISNNSGCGGAALSRRRFGETVAAINRQFPHWFCERFKSYSHNEDTLPFDQHMLLALAAPRALYVASAQEDLWADPRGEFLAALHASPVYALLGQAGLSGREMPALSQPLAEGRIGYHIRPGKHDVTGYDWTQYLDFADRNM